MTDQCSRCRKFIAEGEKVILDLEDYHERCAIEEILEEIPEVRESHRKKIREQVSKAEKVQFSRRRGLEVIR